MHASIGASDLGGAVRLTTASGGITLSALYTTRSRSVGPERVCAPRGGHRAGPGRLRLRDAPGAGFGGSPTGLRQPREAYAPLRGVCRREMSGPTVRSWEGSLGASSTVSLPPCAYLGDTLGGSLGPTRGGGPGRGTATDVRRWGEPFFLSCPKRRARRRQPPSSSMNWMPLAVLVAGDRRRREL
jgi:hypothetical protein